MGTAGRGRRGGKAGKSPVVRPRRSLTAPPSMRGPLQPQETGEQYLAYLSISVSLSLRRARNRDPSGVGLFVNDRWRNRIVDVTRDNFPAVCSVYARFDPREMKSIIFVPRKTERKVDSFRVPRVNRIEVEKESWTIIRSRFLFQRVRARGLWTEFPFQLGNKDV